MTIIGTVVAGKVLTDSPIPLPDGTRVTVEAAETRSSFLERHKNWVGMADLPEDAAHNHDHYLYGSDKRP